MIDFENLRGDWSLLPEHMRDGMWLWIEHGIEPGSFLTAVLCNDLRGSFELADHINRDRLYEFLVFLVQYAPSGCWGSPEKFHAWHKAGGRAGIEGRK